MSHSLMTTDPSAILHTGKGTHESGEPRRELTDLLRRFLQVYWLRPENAFWMTLRSYVLSMQKWSHSSIDIGCGDGVFSFLHHGGVFDPAFDVFQHVTGLESVREQHTDMFNGGDAPAASAVTKSSGETIDVGLDLKPSLLAKAGALNLYGELIKHDNNHSLPFADDSFNTVYCNAAYWVENIDGFIRELARIVNRQGRIILQVKLDCMTDYTLRKHEYALGHRFLDIIDRGRLATWPTLADRQTWERRFTAAGLTITEATPFITATHAHIWDVGLRPIAPLLVRMTQGLTPETRAAIKHDWVDLFLELLKPICDPSFDLIQPASDPAEIQYVLTV